jgi:putative transposase
LTTWSNAYAERWVRTVRRECLDRILIYNARHLLAVLREYLRHYNGHRAHQGRGQRPPDPDKLPAPVTDLGTVRIRRRKVVHGLINEYEQVA